jgi:hypothetical protein
MVSAQNHLKAKESSAKHLDAKNLNSKVGAVKYFSYYPTGHFASNNTFIDLLYPDFL